MSQPTFNIVKDKYKLLSSFQLEYIINSRSQHYALHKGKIRNTDRTARVKSNASDTDTTVSNIYSILIDAKVDIMKSNLTTLRSLSSEAEFNRPSHKHIQSNISKLIKAE